MDQEGAESQPTLAEKLDRLFKTAHRRGEKELTYQEVAEGIKAQGGPSISASYVFELRTGVATNPRKAHLEALAKFFNVSPVYFYEDDKALKIHRQLELLAGMRDARIRNIAARASELSPQGLKALTEIVEHLREAQGTSGAEPKESDADNS